MWELNFEFLIQPLKILPVELLETHKLNTSHEIKLLHNWSFKFVHCRTCNNSYIIYPYDILWANTFHKWESVEEIVANGTTGCKSQAKIIAKLRARLVCVFKQLFLVFKQHFTYFNALFHPHVFPQIFLNNNFQFLNTCTKRTVKISFLIYFYLFSKSLGTLLNNNATIHQGPKAEDPQTKLRNQHGSTKLATPLTISCWHEWNWEWSSLISSGRCP